MEEFDYIITIGSRGGVLRCACTGPVPTHLAEAVAALIEAARSDPGKLKPVPPVADNSKPEAQKKDPIGSTMWAYDTDKIS